MQRDLRTASRGPRPARPGDRDLSKPLPAALSWWVLVGFAAAVLGALVLEVLPWWVGAWYGAWSLLAFTLYGLDKAAAKRGASRVSEQTLHLVDVVGGWPGALVAQQVFRHKTRKRSFRRVFWAGVVLNLVVLVVVAVWFAGR
ncbi:DUF1294 domain-containing protein [Agromyces sp. NPDC058136]|uniref:DUF1294 domain-containing protein n=1 Tax=Agromyces sp. NPDC058136 TaxID=3346354 RepID=UPI0036D80B1B